MSSQAFHVMQQSSKCKHKKMKISSLDLLCERVMTLNLRINESSKCITQAMTFITAYTVTHISYIQPFTYNHPIRFHLVKEIRKITCLASIERDYIISRFEHR